AAQRALRRRESAVEYRRADGEGIRARSGERVDLFHRMHAARDDQPAGTDTAPRGVHERQRIRFGGAVREEIDATAAALARGARITLDLRRRAFEPRRMTDRPTGE